jgi:hypothetical protein
MVSYRRYLLMMDISKIFGVYEKEITLVSLPEKDRNVRIPVAEQITTD